MSPRRRLAAALALAALLLAPGAHATIEEAVTLDPFGKVVLYRELPRPARVILVLSDAHGWQRGAIEVARALADQDALVVGIDLPRYLATQAARGGDDLYPSADLEVLSQFVQRKARLPSYVPPVVVGFGGGAAMAYAVAVQARPATFAGAVSLGFCPTLVTPRPLGRDNGLAWSRGDAPDTYRLEPATASATPWVAFQGRAGHGCDASTVRRFVAAVPGATLVDVATDEPVLVDPEAWLPAMRRTLAGLGGGPPSPRNAAGAVGDLPLVEVPARGTPTATLAVVLSGDGGWASLDREVGDALAAAGVGVVGWNSLSYYWTARTPDGAAADLARVLRHYRDAWRPTRVILIGYSRGADVLPFLASRLPPDLRALVALVALLGPGRTTDFEFHVTDWIGGDDPDARPVRPEVEKLGGLRVLCVQGDAENDSLCPDLDARRAARMVLPGGHHFGGDYGVIAARILAESGLAAAAQPSATP